MYTTDQAITGCMVWEEFLNKQEYIDLFDGAVAGRQAAVELGKVINDMADELISEGWHVVDSFDWDVVPEVIRRLYKAQCLTSATEVLVHAALKQVLTYEEPENL